MGAPGQPAPTSGKRPLVGCFLSGKAHGQPALHCPKLCISHAREDRTPTRHLDRDENRMGMVNRERYQSHTVVQRGRAAPPRVAQYPPELQHMDSPQPREQPAGCPSPASHQGQSLGCWRIGDGNMLWVTALLQPEGCPWGSFLPAVAGKQTGADSSHV